MTNIKLKHPDSKQTVEVSSDRAAEAYQSQGWAVVTKAPTAAEKKAAAKAEKEAAEAQAKADAEAASAAGSTE